MGFFTSGELQKSSEVKIDPSQLEPKCLDCGLYKQCKHPKMPVSGEGRKGILLIGEAPSESSDIYGSQFSGDSGRYLASELKRHKVSINRDCWKLDAVSCHHPEPTHKHIKCCYPKVEKTIRELKPKLIILLGSLAITSLFGDDFSRRTEKRWRGYCIPDEKFKCFIFPTFSESFVYSRERDKNLHATFERDIASAVKCLKLKFKRQINYEKCVTVLKDYKSVRSLLNKLLKREKPIMFDYETTGLKPYRVGHKIVSIGIAVSEEKAFAFPYDYKSFWTKDELRKIKALWKKILENGKVLKMAHNIKFEDCWSAIRAGARMKGWYWDPMLAEHILDNRKGANGLKFQTFVKFGIRPYDKTIKPFLKSKKGEFNTVEQAPFRELMVYNGLDCIYALKLMKQQKARLAGMKKLGKAYGFFFRGNYTMSTIQLNGIRMREKYYQKVKIELTDKVAELQKYLTSGREARAFRKKFNRDIKITSNQDLGKLFYEVLGKDPVYTNEKQDNYKTDKATLESLNLPFVDKLAEMKRLEKARGTYIGQFTREIYKSKMHPFFDLSIPVSYRSSSSKPNFQNLPKRDPSIKEKIRKGIVPSKNCVICEADFSGAEVITSVCYHKDKNFYNYLIDKSTDMHRDNATDLWLLPKDMLANPDYDLDQKKKVKNIRFFAKNNWTFAQFYGDWFGSCGPLLWENCVESGMELPTGQTLKDHLADQKIYELGEVEKGVPTPGSFLDHCAEVQHKMWNERFPEYTQWKKDIVDFYLNYGYIETYFGFRFVGYMDDKQCANFPIQGTSFHLLVYTLIQIEKFIRKHKLRTKLIGQIHDSVIADVHKEELAFYLKGVQDIVTSLKDRFKWLIVPMEIEAEISRLREDRGNFAELREVDPLKPELW